MTKLQLKFVQGFVDRHGQPRFYFRRRGLARVALPGLPGSSQFMEAYQAALGSAPVAIGTSTCSGPGSISFALAQYFDSLPFRDLGNGTQVSRKCILERFRDQHGHLPLASLPKEFCVALIDSMLRHQARNWLKAFRHFIKWAADRKLIAADPTLGIRVRLPKSDGHHCWDESEIAAFEAKHPIGSKARLALALGLYTAQRRGDVVKIGRQHIRDGVLRLRQNKTGATLAIPVHADLQEIINATTSTDLTLPTTKRGKPYSADALSVQFRTWCNAAGLPRRCKFHGLRKAACRRLAEAGCSASEIAAISGHATLAEVSRYTKAVDQAGQGGVGTDCERKCQTRADPSVKPLERIDQICGLMTRFGSKADIREHSIHVRFTPKSRHRSVS